MTTSTQQTVGATVRSVSLVNFIKPLAAALALSLGCLGWGSVYDLTLAALLLSLVLIAFLPSPTLDTVVETKLVKVGLTLILILFAVLVLQKLLSLTSFPLTLSSLSSIRIYDHAAWWAMAGRYLLWLVTFFLCLQIATSHRQSIAFLSCLLLFGGILVLLTFLYGNRYHYDQSANFSHGFINPNNAASYIGCLFLLSLWQLHRQIRRIRAQRYKGVVDMIDSISLVKILQILAVLFLMLLFFATMLMTGSRGGILSCFIAAAVFGGIVIFKHTQRRSLSRYAIFISGGMISVLLLFTVFFQHFSGLLVKDIDREGLALHLRPTIALSTLELIADNPLLGVGIGGFPEGFPYYRSDKMLSEGLIDKAHNSYIELTAEIGIPAAMAFFIGVFILLRILIMDAVRRRKHYSLSALGLAMVTHIGLHSLIDFPMQIPALAATVLSILLICGLRSEMYEFSQKPETSVS